MDNLDDSENNAKISDSAYSNSCSNSQSRRSHSSKSTHSGSNSSGSSGYGGKPSTSGYNSSNNQSQPVDKRIKDKEAKKKKSLQSLQTDLQANEVKNEIECIPEITPVFESSKEKTEDVNQTPTPGLAQTEQTPDLMEVSDRSSGKDEPAQPNTPIAPPISFVTSRPTPSQTPDGFSCVISMQDGVVMYTTASITTALGFPKDMWIGRSFIDFVHQRDRNTFASQITSGLATPRHVKNGSQAKAPALEDHISTMVCRIRRYKGLNNGFGIKERVVTFMPFLLKFFFKNMNEDEGKVVYLVIQASPFFSAFKTPSEVVTNPITFIIRHSASGRLDYIDPESVPYLGYLPQDIVEKDALQLYHPSDLMYLRQVYETIVKEGGVQRSKPYRMMAQNGDFLKLETEWTSFINPWSRKLEFIIGKHFVIEGPVNPDVFQTPESDKGFKLSIEEETKAQAIRENMIRVMNELLTKPAEAAKQQMSKRCQDLASFMEGLMDETTAKPENELRLELQEADHSYYERDSVMLGGISPHHDHNDSNSSSVTPPSYNQLNYNENLERYFNSQEPFTYEEESSSRNLAVNTDLQGSRPVESNDDPSLSAIPSTSHASTLNKNQPLRLTESLLNKHNSEMEKELVKMHRELRMNSNKNDREITSNECRQRKKEHRARCSTFNQSTATGLPAEIQPHGVKRAFRQTEEGKTYKHQCSSLRAGITGYCQSPINAPSLAMNNVPSPWPTNQINSPSPHMYNWYLQSQTPVTHTIVRPVPSFVPMYYTPAPMNPPMMSNNEGGANSNQPITYYTYLNQNTVQPQGQVGGSDLLFQMNSVYSMNDANAANACVVNANAVNANIPPNQGVPEQQDQQYQNTVQPQGQVGGSDLLFQMNSVYSMNDANAANACVVNANAVNANVPPNQGVPEQQDQQLQYMMLGQAVYGSPFMYSAINPQISYAMSSSTYIPKRSPQPLGLSSSNYEEACKLTMPSKSGKTYFGNSKREKVPQGRANKGGQECDFGSASAGVSDRSTDGITAKRKSQLYNSDGTNDKTDGESSYSSFYSSFFKTDSGSNEESDSKNPNRNEDNLASKSKKSRINSLEYVAGAATQASSERKVARRKMEPPWLEQVCVTSELIYKYQIISKNVEEVLSSDREKLKSLQQPSLVNEQLGQLYLDLQLEGVAARLTLEEGITSSSSSGEETTAKLPKIRRRKREYNRLVMIYEEDAPLPPPDAIS